MTYWCDSKHLRSFACLVIGSLTLIPSNGCGSSDRGNVAGTLQRNDGTPLVGARVVIRSVSTGESAHGITDSAGKFDLGASAKGGLSPGEYEVLILEDRGSPDQRQPLTIAAKYRDPAASGLKVNVSAGEQTALNLTLEPPN